MPDGSWRRTEAVQHPPAFSVTGDPAVERTKHEEFTMENAELMPGKLAVCDLKSPF